MASVANTSTVYPLLGRPHDALRSDSENYTLSYPTYVGAQYDASVTNLTYRISSPNADGQPVELVLSFLSPVTPTSTLRQSIPASYFSIHATGDFDVEVYVDVNGQWVSGDRGSHIKWALEHTDLNHGKSLKTWTVKRDVELLYTEHGDQAEWGTLRFTAPGVCSACKSVT